jgi:two-component SAPR family response regulator
LHHAVEINQGQLLPNCYCDWITPKRERIYQEFLLVLVEIIQLLEKIQEYEAAISFARRLILIPAANQATLDALECP